MKKTLIAATCAMRLARSAMAGGPDSYAPPEVVVVETEAGRSSGTTTVVLPMALLVFGAALSHG
ncbi:hypothetical protein [Marinovum sp.]|uniref:hypothetical protein n=1 Tax=Marinovum sp. TaxID=2024839 RepID=UPI002B26D25E|nr:hypothetical protein [Marinovum sp.]